MSNSHPLHCRHVGRTECDAVAVHQPNQARCDNCHSSLSHRKPAFYCRQCDISLCTHCDKGFPHPAHKQHPLYVVNPGPWRCDACKLSRVDLRETCSYHCEVCSFDLCKKCFDGFSHPIHAHRLSRTDVRQVYHQSLGDWFCDNCGHNNGPGNYLPWHCEQCQFDLCDNCCMPWKSLHHPHDLYRVDSKMVYGHFNGGWRCDICSATFSSEMNCKPYHCFQCDFDSCEDCMRTGGDLSTRGSALPPPMTSAGDRAITFPMDDAAEQVGRTGPPDDAGECVICLERPKDATIVHGSTGHVCCCTTCALQLERKGDRCPICRAPIDRVIKQYTV